MNKFNLGDIVYFIANGYHVREATIIRKGAGFCTIKFNDMKLQQELESENPSYSRLSRKLKLQLKKHITHCYTRLCWMSHKS